MYVVRGGYFPSLPSRWWGRGLLPLEWGVGGYINPTHLTSQTFTRRNSVRKVSARCFFLIHDTKMVYVNVGY